MKPIETPLLLPCLLSTSDSNQVVSVCCFRGYCWYNCRRWLVDISTVRALITEVSLLLIYF
ncbi:hypothetical protein BDZ91DRAFT_748841 [Kalaharituber pfeilii]|nr:hypothetical protein BDZ91DRAFT_748841 [Kalaharituber pfeilii]